MLKRRTRRQAGKAENRFYSFLSHRNAEALNLYMHRAFKMAPRSLKLNAAAQAMNSVVLLTMI